MQESVVAETKWIENITLALDDVRLAKTPIEGYKRA